MQNTELLNYRVGQETFNHERPIQNQETKEVTKLELHV